MSKIIAIDSGYGQLKGKSCNVEVKIESIIGSQSVASLKEFQVDSSLEGIVIKYNSKVYVVGKKAVNLCLDANYNMDIVKATSEEEIVKLLAVSYYLTEPYDRVTLVLGLPVMEYKVQKQKLIDTMQGCYEYQVYLKGWHKRVLQIAQVIVMPQSCGAFYDYILGNDGSLTSDDLEDKNVGVVDIGFRTTDLVLFNKGFDYNPLQSVTEDWAMLNVYEDLRVRLSQTPTIHMNVSLDRLSDVVKTRKCCGIDCNKLVNVSLGILLVKYRKSIIALWKDMRLLDKVLITSGGGLALRPLLSGNKYLYSKDCEMANVRGYYKYACLLEDGE